MGLFRAARAQFPLKKQKRRRFLGAVLVSADVTLALTGIASTTAIGSLSQNTSIGLTGVAATTGLDTVVPSSAVPITGVSSTTDIGTVTRLNDGALTGVSSTSGIGTLTPSSLAALTGPGLTGSVGTMTGDGTAGASTTLRLKRHRRPDLAEFNRRLTNTPKRLRSSRSVLYVSTAVTAALTGVSATGSPGTVVVGAARALTGNASSTAVGTVVAADITLALTGNPSFATVGNVLPVGQIIHTRGRRHVRPMYRLMQRGLLPNPQPRRPPVFYHTDDTALTGVLGLVLPGSVGVSLAAPLTGNSATGTLGNVGVSITGGSVTVSITGTAANAAVGSVTANPSAALTGVAATAAAGTLPAIGREAALTGIAATGAVNSMYLGSLGHTGRRGGLAGGPGSGKVRPTTGTGRHIHGEDD